MPSEKGRLDQENFVDTSLLLDAVTSLIDAFKQAGYNPPISIRVDKRAFNRLLDEASKLYSSINVKESIAKHEFSIANIINIILENGKEEADNRNNHYSTQKQKVTQSTTAKSTIEDQVIQQLGLSNTAKKYECADCDAIFDTPAGHRKHHQAFHGKIKEPKVTERTEI